MTLDESIKRYTNNAEYERMVGNLQGCLDFRQLAEWLSELKQLRERTKWIPTSERLPEDDGLYLVYTEEQPFVCPFENGEFFIDEVVAWMPLPVPMIPEPYKGESEENYEKL